MLLEKVAKSENGVRITNLKLIGLLIGPICRESVQSLGGLSKSTLINEFRYYLLNSRE